MVIEPLRDDGTPAVLPYTAADLAGGRRWLEALGDGPLSLADLANAWQDAPEERGKRPEFVASAGSTAGR